MARSSTFGASVMTGLPLTLGILFISLPGTTYQSYHAIHCSMVTHNSLEAGVGWGKDRPLRSRPSNPLWEPNPYLSTQGSLAPILPTLD